MNTSDLDNSLREAEQHRLAGRLDEAERIYRGVLEAIPESGEIRFLLGCLYVRAGRFAEAAVELQEAVRLLPQFADARIVLGNIFISQHRWSEAVEMLATAAQLRPDLLPVKSNLALALFASDRGAEAEELLREILSVDPDNREAHYNLAFRLVGEGRNEEAEPYARRAVELAPGDAAALSVLGAALSGSGRWKEAEEVHLRAQAIEPDRVRPYLDLYALYRDQGRLELAERAARLAAQVDPECGPALDALGVALTDLGRLDEAIDHFRSAAAIAPSYLIILEHLADAYSDKGELEEAVACSARALELDPSDSARSALAYRQIRTGRYREGWKNLRPGESWPNLPAGVAPPKWTGEALDGRTLLVHYVGGIGDTIQFIRYVPAVTRKYREARVVFQCQPALMDLLGGMPGFENVVMQAADYRGDDLYIEPPVAVDYYIGAYGLPAFFTVSEETVPSGLLPIRIREAEAADWRRRLAGLPGLKVGFCWAGSPSYDDDRNRSMRLESFAPFADVDGLNLVSLQVGPPAEQIHSGGHGLQMLHVPEELSPWTKTAALMRELDLVISVDTATAHLAGALGVETWLLLPYVTHWIWNAYRPDDTAWYPKHRLFRQSAPRDWTPVVARVRRELLERITRTPARNTDMG